MRNWRYQVGCTPPHPQAAPGIMRTKLVWNWRYKRGRIPPQCAPPLKLGRELEFWVFGEVKIFLISGGLPYERGRGISLGEVSSFYVHFPILKCKDSKIEKFNIHIFIFKIHARFQIGKDYNTESKFSCSRNSLFSPVSGYSKPTKPIKLLSFWFIWYV